jgi:hypothetical protein
LIIRDLILHQSRLFVLFDAAVFALYNCWIMNKWMNHSRLMNFGALILILLFGSYYYLTLIQVPFHPDESTYIYMSGDFERFLSQPLGMIHDQGRSQDPQQHYRLVDPPLTRYWIGAALAITGIEPLKQDWDWSSSWQANIEMGALPADELLLVSRLAVSSLFLLGLYAIYRTGILLHNRLTGLLAVILLASNSLVLLHTRRSMEEALLLPAMCLSIWSISSINRRPWLAGLAVLMAINIKLSALPLFFIGVLAIFLLDSYQTIRPSKRFINLFILTAVILAGTYILNPVAWADPWLVLKLSISERSQLILNQMASLRSINPDLVLDTPIKRLAGLITHAFFSYPASLDVGNYRQELSVAIDTYDATAGTRFLRGISGGILTLILTLFGSLLMLVRVMKQKPFYASFQFLTITGLVVFVTAMTIAISLPFQRYVLPVLPYLCLISGWGISQVVQPDKKKLPPE